MLQQQNISKTASYNAGVVVSGSNLEIKIRDLGEGRFNHKEKLLPEKSDKVLYYI